MVQGDPQPVVLLAEDNALVGLDLRDALEEMGYRVAGPFSRCSDALLWLSQETPDLALLDVMLDDGPSAAIAVALRRQGVPFLVHSGRHPDEALARAFAGAPWLDKPAPSRAVTARLTELARVEARA
ncbi:MAG: response regulator [Methylobacterium frigidaeris]